MSGWELRRRRPSGRGRSYVLAALVAVLVAAVGCSVWFGMRAHELREASAGNAALVDVERTEEVVQRVRADLKAVFSYDHTNLERTQRAVDLALTGEAKREYREEFTAAAERAKRDEIVRASTVRSIGVRELTGSRAKLLVFLDQQTLRKKTERESSTATLDVTAVRVDGTWRISRITTL